MMANKQVGAMLVTSDGKLVGIISKRDYALSHTAGKIFETNASERNSGPDRAIPGAARYWHSLRR